MAFGVRKSIVGQTRNITKEFGKAHLICHDGKYLATLLPSVGSLVTLGKCLHQRHVHPGGAPHLRNKVGGTRGLPLVVLSFNTAITPFPAFRV